MGVVVVSLHTTQFDGSLIVTSGACSLLCLPDGAKECFREKLYSFTFNTMTATDTAMMSPKTRMMVSIPMEIEIG
jgi:hypothetical protein